MAAWLHVLEEEKSLFMVHLRRPIQCVSHRRVTVEWLVGLRTEGLPGKRYGPHWRGLRELSAWGSVVLDYLL